MLVSDLLVFNRAKKEGRSRTEGLPERAVVSAPKGDRTRDGGVKNKEFENRDVYENVDFLEISVFLRENALTFSGR